MFLHRLESYFCAARFGITALAMVWLFASSAFAEEKPLTVTVVDQKGQSIEDAVIVAATKSLSTKPASALSAIMDQQDKQFHPRVLVVNTGTQVSFPNSDNISHHVYSFSEPKHFEIKLYADAPNEPVTFDTPCVVVLGCNIHDKMVGYIFVSDSTNFSKTTTLGQATLTSSNERPNKLSYNIYCSYKALDDPTSPIMKDNIEWSQAGQVEIQITIKGPVTQTKTSRFR